MGKLRSLATRLHALTCACVTMVSGCSDVPDNYDQLSPIEQAILHPDRPRDDKKRDKYRHPAEVLELAGITPGLRILDILGGGGYYTELFSRLSGETGEVFLQNNSLFLRFSSEELDKRLSGDRLPNVRRIDSEFADMKFPDQVDLAFLGLSYHDIYVPREDPVIQADPADFKEQLWAAIKPGGRLLVIDHAAPAGSGITSAPKLHRIDEEYVVRDLEEIGFNLIDRLDTLRNSKDDYSKSIWAEGVMHNTDRFVLLFSKPIEH